MEESTLPSGVSRRELLAAIGGGASVTVAGCSELGGSSDPEDEASTTEIIVGNGADDPTMIAVVVENGTGETVFNRVYELGPEKADESAGIEAVPAAVTVFTPDGNAANWELPAPDPDDGCTEALGIRLLPDGTFQYSYSC
jgi:hypothetical protein